MIFWIKYIVCILLLFTFCSIHGQNLVPNNGFESYTNCPYNGSQLNFAAPWNKPPGHLGTPDYFNACAVPNPSYAWTLGVPSNFFGIQAAYAGNGYVGLYTYFAGASDTREYISIGLSSPLVSGNVYSVGFYVNRADIHRYACDGLGAFLSNGTPTIGPTVNSVLAATPQISNPAGNLLLDSVGWTLISGTYIATGGEDRITIGNFKTNVNTAVLQMNANPLFGLHAAYYYVDEVFVIPGAILVTGNDICHGDSVTLNAYGDTLYTWANSSSPNTIIGSGSTITVSPQITTTYNVYGMLDSASYTVNVNTSAFDANINLGNDTTLCQGESLILDATIANFSYVWQDNSTNSTFNVVQQGTYWVTATIDSCSVSDTIEVYYTPLPPIDLGSDVVLCTGDTLILDATTPNGNYLWQDNSTNGTFMVTQQGTYSLLLTVNNCSSDDTVSVYYTQPISVDLGPDLSLCEGQMAILDATTTNANYFWQDGGTQAQYLISQSGQYFVDVTNSCETVSDTVNVDYFIPPTNYLGNDTSLCEGSSLLLTVNIPGTQTQWQDQSITTSYVVNEAGVYSAISTTQEGCEAADQITVDYVSIPRINLGPDKRVCDINQYVIENLTGDHGDYLWSTGSQNDQLIINAWGTYFLQLSNFCGTVSDTIIINDNACNCWVYIPNSFTPNNDEFNGMFGTKYECIFSEFTFSIFNRWGELIWLSNDPDVKWDGTYKNQPVQDGVYSYQLKYSNDSGSGEFISGHFSVLK